MATEKNDVSESYFFIYTIFVPLNTSPLIPDVN